MNEKFEFEMASLDSPEEIVAAAQRSFVKSMLLIVSEMKAQPEIKAPGLTWEQLEYFISEFGKRKPKIIIQNNAV